MPFGWLLPASFALILEVAVIYYTLGGAWKRVPAVLGFCAVQVLVGCTNAIFFGRLGGKSQTYYKVFWTGDILAHLAIVSLIISLVYLTLNGQESQSTTTKLLMAAVLCFGLASAYMFYSPHLNRWMTPVSRNLSFGEEVLNLILWSMLLQRRANDYLILMVSAGIGVQVTGEVIGHTLRIYTHSPSTVWVPNLLVYISEIVCLCIWVWAFRSARAQFPARGVPPSVPARAVVRP